MSQSWKVVVAFVGVFVAGAVFGGFFTLGIARGSRVEAQPVAAPPPAPKPAAPAVPATPSAPSAPLHPAAAAKLGAAQATQFWQAPQLMRRYAERLDLTPEQKQKINPLFQRAAEDYRRVQQHTYRETNVVLQRLQQDLAKELTPEQREKLARWEQAQREKLQRFEQGVRARKAPNGAKAGARPKDGAETSVKTEPPAADAPASGAAAAAEKAE